jgi:GNAT superfamily N-acetyltransferase
MSLEIQQLTAHQFGSFVELLNALADYEELDRPDADAVERLRRDAFENRPRFEAVLAMEDNHAVGYAIYFETYSSFLARPTMYLEDVFVLESYRSRGIGSALFEHVRQQALQRGCGRMEWQVLEWNTLARDFYHHRNAEWMKQWLPYRLTL